MLKVRGETNGNQSNPCFGCPSQSRCSDLCLDGNPHDVRRLQLATGTAWGQRTRYRRGASLNSRADLRRYTPQLSFRVPVLLNLSRVLRIHQLFSFRLFYRDTVLPLGPGFVISLLCSTKE